MLLAFKYKSSCIHAKLYMMKTHLLTSPFTEKTRKIIETVTGVRHRGRVLGSRSILEASRCSQEPPRLCSHETFLYNRLINDPLYFISLEICSCNYYCIRQEWGIILFTWKYNQTIFSNADSFTRIFEGHSLHLLK